MMKIVFLNVWYGKMQTELTEYIKNEAQDTDIFCFQENSGEAKGRISELLQNYKEISEIKYFSEVDDYGQSIFVRNDLEVVSSGALMTHETELGLAVYVEIKIGDKNLYLSNIHGKSRPIEKLDNPNRLEQSRQLIELFKDKDGPIIIGGDFNLEPDTESIKMFEKNGYRNLIKEFNIKTTRNQLAWARFPGNELYYSDYIFLNDKVKLKSFRVIDNAVSDHLPLILEVD